MAQVLRSLLWTGERDPALSKVKEVDLFISHLAMSNEEEATGSSPQFCGALLLEIVGGRPFLVLSSINEGFGHMPAPKS